MTFLTWAQLKPQVYDKGLLRPIDREAFYKVEFNDFYTTIEKDGGADQIDFETNFLNHANKNTAVDLSPFAAKTIPGYKLFRRVHGQTATLAAEGDTTVEFSVTYGLCKIDEVQMRWLPEGVTGDFIVAHPTYGPLSQHAFGVPLAKDSHTDKSAYDATLQSGLILRMVFHNPTTTTKTIGVAWVLHEMVAL